MKSEEDEAFDDLAKRQGSWGGGYRAKRAAAADKLQEPEREVLKLALEALEAMQMYAAAERKGLRICDEAITAIKEALAQPAQEPVKDALEQANFKDAMVELCKLTTRSVQSAGSLPSS